MARHADLLVNMGVKVSQCDPQSFKQCGWCENSSGLIRQYLPEGTDLLSLSREQLDTIADLLNNRMCAVNDTNGPSAFTQPF